MSETPTSSTPSRGEALSGNTSGDATGETAATSAHAGARSSAEPANRSAESARSSAGTTRNSAAATGSSATPTSGIEASTQSMEAGTPGSATPAEGVTAPTRQSATPAPTSSDEQRPRNARAERATVRIRIPDGWGRSLLAGVEGALLGWALSTTLVLVTYLGVSGNPWMGKISWDDAMAIGSDMWAMSLGSPLTINEVTYRAIPLLMTALAVVILRLLLFTGRNFPASALWFAVPAYMGTTALLVGTNTAHHSWPATMIGAFVCSMLATAWAALGQTRASYRKACALARETDTTVPEPPRILQIPNWLRIGLRQGVAMTGVIVGASLIALIAVVVMRWENVVAIADLLQPATTVDTTMLAIAQALFVPTAGAWLAAWAAGPGFVLGPDAVHSLTSAPTAPIPPVPFLGVLPSAPVGVWLIVAPLALGALVGALFVWRGRLPSLREQAYALGVAGGVFALFVSVWMWLSVLTLGQGRLVGIGPRLQGALPALLGEILGVVALVVLLSHPTTVAWMKGRRTDAQAALAASGLGQKIRAGRADGSEDEADAAATLSDETDSAADDSDGPTRSALGSFAASTAAVAAASEERNPDDTPTEVIAVAATANGDSADLDSTEPDAAELDAAEPSEAEDNRSVANPQSAPDTEPVTAQSPVTAEVPSADTPSPADADSEASNAGSEDIAAGDAAPERRSAEDGAPQSRATKDSDQRPGQNPLTGEVDTASVDTSPLYGTARRPRSATEADNIPTTRIPRIEDSADD